MTAMAAHEAIARHSKSFALAARLLPPATATRAAALYAWCRACDDAIDLGRPEDHAALLAAREAALDALYAGARPADPDDAAFQHVARTCRIPIDYPRELLAGLRMDTEHCTYADRDALLLYAFRVAGTVGLMMCHVLGVADERHALVHAAHLGMGMQLTNICRDVAEDWTRGRLYLPADLFPPDTYARLHSRLGGPLPIDAAAPIADAVRRLLALADHYYASGDRGLAYLDRRAAASIGTARQVYAAIGAEIARRGCDVLGGRAVVPTATKLRLAARAVRAAMRRRPAPASRFVVPTHALSPAAALAPLPEATA